jgi:hypothetical protein
MRIRWAVHVAEIKKYLHFLAMESLGKLLVGRLRRISKNVMKYSMEMDNGTGSVACPTL